MQYLVFPNENGPDEHIKKNVSHALHKRGFVMRVNVF
jgi:hypothetical protein